MIVNKGPPQLSVVLELALHSKDEKFNNYHNGLLTKYGNYHGILYVSTR